MAGVAAFPLNVTLAKHVTVVSAEKLYSHEMCIGRVDR